METDFVYHRHFLPSGVKVEEISGGEDRSGKVWRALAMQIYCENGKDDYREVGHFDSGAPFLFNSDERISISHTDHILVVATVKTDENTKLSAFDHRSAVGIDAERADREKVTGLRERFLTEEELERIPAESLEANITAWTAKEALYKAALTPGLNWHHDIIITKLPAPGDDGTGIVRIEGKEYGFRLETYRSGDYIVTVASPQ